MPFFDMNLRRAAEILLMILLVQAVLGPILGVSVMENIRMLQGAVMALAGAWILESENK